MELCGWRRASLVTVLAVLAQFSAAIPSEVVASSNTNILSHRVFEREEAFVCFVCENGLLGSPVNNYKAFRKTASHF